jgi:hypothetical protein
MWRVDFAVLACTPVTETDPRVLDVGAGVPSFIDLYGLDRDIDERRCVICGREGEPIAVYGHTPVVIIVGRPTPPPPNIVFCDWCANDHHLGPGVSLAEDLINAWRVARGLPERDFSNR